MNVISHFRLENLPNNSESRRLISNKGFIGPIADSVDIAGQFRCSIGYILLLTDNIPYEERVNILLLNPSGLLLDQVEIGAPLMAGVLENLLPSSNSGRLCFDIFDHQWELKVHEEAKYWLNFCLPRSASRSVRRFFGARYIELKHV